MGVLWAGASGLLWKWREDKLMPKLKYLGCICLFISRTCLIILRTSEHRLTLDPKKRRDSLFGPSGRSFPLFGTVERRKMIPNGILAKEKEWALAGLENIFHYALQEKSKCLIQACILIAEQEFFGVSSFGHPTQVKFLLESIRHIISDNCQEEFIHIMQYLKLLHSLCSEIGCEEQYVNSMLKIRQSYVLYTLLDNESASDVCLAMNDLFPKDDPLKSFSINKSSMRKRFLALIRRQIYSFQKLVTKLLTDIEFRQYYFFDEWTEEFGTSFHKEMISDIDLYLRKIEEHLLAGTKSSGVYLSWPKSHNLRNPAILCFLKILAETKSDSIPEFDILSFLKWVFPSLDTSLLTMPCVGSVSVPENLKGTSFVNLLCEMGKATREAKPWDCDNFHQALVKIAESKHRAIYSPKSFYGGNTIHKRKENIPIYHLSNRPSIDVGKPGRVPIGQLDSNTLSTRSSVRVRKRKRAIAGHDDVENQVPKKQCMAKVQLHKLESIKNMSGTLRKSNVPGHTPKSSEKHECTDSNEAIKMSFSSPYCKLLLESGSKFFSSGGKRKTLRSLRVAPAFQTPILDESSLGVIEFSDNEEDCGSGSDILNIVDETMNNGLTWICGSKTFAGTPTSHRSRSNRTCRSLHFKSESSDDHVSESESELPAYLQPTLQDVLTSLDLTLVPDLTYHLKKSKSKACTVRLECMSDLIIEKNTVEGCRINDKDLKTILRQEPEFRFRNYSKS